MTRISATYQPIEQCDKMLGAELYEILRIPNHILKVIYNKNKEPNMSGQPLKFKLGGGHVKFFYDKIAYLKRRYEAIVAELINRGVEVSEVYDKWHKIPAEYFNDWEPTYESRQIMCERINERLQTMKSFKMINNIKHLKYYGEWVPIENLYIKPENVNYDL